MWLPCFSWELGPGCEEGSKFAAGLQAASAEPWLPPGASLGTRLPPGRSLMAALDPGPSEGNKAVFCVLLLF